MERLLRVFLADSSSDLRRLLRDVLSREGMTVIGTAADGDSALERLRAEQPDVLITELLLPGRDGLSLLRALREEGIMPRTIVLSAFWNDRMARAVARAGADCYLPKPCRVETLCERALALAREAAAPVPAPDAAVRAALLRFPVPAHLSGYRYLGAGLEQVLRDRDSLQGVTKALYRDLARRFGTTDKCVERSMRAAIVRGWAAGSREGRRRAFGAAFEGFDRPPTITAFLSVMAEHLSLESADRTL